MQLMLRREFIKAGLNSLMAGGVFLLAISRPYELFAAWAKSAFDAKTPEEAMKELLGTAQAESNDRIEIVAPEIAENGTVVPIRVKTSLEAKSISIIAPKNPRPLVVHFEVSKFFAGFVETRVKLQGTQRVAAVVESGGKLYRASKKIQVTIGGCGG